MILDFVGTDETLALAGDVVAPGGLVMLVGEGGGQLPFGFERPAVEAWLTTTAWGSIDELREVVRWPTDRRVAWDVETIELVDAQSAHERLRTGGALGRIVLVPANRASVRTPSRRRRSRGPAASVTLCL